MLPAPPRRPSSPMPRPASCFERPAKRSLRAGSASSPLASKSALSCCSFSPSSFAESGQALFEGRVRIFAFGVQERLELLQFLSQLLRRVRVLLPRFLRRLDGLLRVFHRRVPC